MTPRDVAAQSQTVLEDPVPVLEEADPAHPDRLAGGQLLRRPQPGGLLGAERVHAGLAAGEQQVGDVGAAGGPGGDGGGGAVLDVVGVRDDAEHAAERVGGERRHRGRGHGGHARAAASSLPAGAARGPGRPGRRHPPQVDGSGPRGPSSPR